MENNQSSHRSFGKWLRDEYKITIILLRSIPASVVALFVISVIAMNILANKTLIQEEWIAIDGGILISWLSFLSMDVVVKHFGPKASTVALPSVESVTGRPAQTLKCRTKCQS